MMLKSFSFLIKFKLQKKAYLIQFIKFSIVGVINTLIDFSVYTLLTRLFEFWRHYYLGANFISFSIAVTNSFYWNKKWTFKDKSKNYHIQFLKFFIINFIGLGLNEFFLYFFVEYIHLYDLIAKGIAIGIVLFWNFGASKFWAFRKSSFNTF